MTLHLPRTPSSSSFIFESNTGRCMREGRFNRSKVRSTACIFSTSVYQVGSYMLSNRQEAEMSSAQAARGCSCRDIWGPSPGCATWWMNRPLCVLGEISGDTVLIMTCINVILVYLALLKQCQEDPYGRMKESQAVCVLSKPIWHSCCRQGSHGLYRECPAVAGSTCVRTGA